MHECHRPLLVVAIVVHPQYSRGLMSSPLASTPQTTLSGCIISTPLGSWCLVNAKVISTATSTVVFAQSTTTDERVALKIISKDVSIEHVTAEIEALRSLRHPNIVHFIDASWHSDSCILVCELAEQDLFERISTRGCLTESLARQLFQQLMRGLAHCHSMGYAHRDVKPENLLLCGNNQLKITDFGHSMKLEGKKLGEEFCGTPRYRAPEVCSREPYDPRCIDVWSSGVTLYVMVKGSFPFTEATPMCENFVKACHGDWSILDNFSEELQHLLRRMMHPEAHQRATVAEVLASEWLTEGSIGEGNLLGTTSFDRGCETPRPCRPISVDVVPHQTSKKRKPNYEERLSDEIEIEIDLGCEIKFAMGAESKGYLNAHPKRNKVKKLQL